MRVEEWLEKLRLAPGTRTKTRNVFSALYTHAIRYEWFDKNPIQKVRSSSARLKDPEVLTPREFRRLVDALGVREKAMVMLAGSTGLRRSEMFALRWSDISLETREIRVVRGVVRNKMGEVKTKASRRPVPLHENLATILWQWRLNSLYSAEGDFLFASERLNGK